MRLTRILGILTIALVAVIPLVSLAETASTFLTQDGMKAVASPLFVQILIFGTTCAATGEMMSSIIISFVIMHALRAFFTRSGGSYASQYVKDDVVRTVQEKIFSYEQPTSS